MPHRLNVSDAKLRSFAARLMIGNVAIIALLSVAAWVGLNASRDADKARAVDTVQNTAASLAAEIGAEFRLVDNALASAAAAYQAGFTDGTGDPAIEKVLRHQKSLLPELDAIRIAGPDGLVRAGLPAGMAPISVADRDYFVAARQAGGSVVSEPLQGRISKKWGVILARRIENKDGSFGGVAYSNLYSEHFARKFSKLKLGEAGAVALRSKELRLVARFVSTEPISDKNVGSSSVSQDLKEALERNPERGWYQTRTVLDGVERITAYQKVPGYELTVLTGLAPSDFLAPWRRDVQGIAALLLLAGLSIVGASLGVFVQRRRNVMVERQVVSLLQQQNLMLDNELIGMARLEARQAKWSNRALTTIFGYDSHELDGQPARVLYFDDGSYERVGSEGYAALQSNNRYRTQLKMKRKDGSPVWIDLSGTPVSDQESLWMFVDITALKGREEQLAQLALHDPLTGLANRTQFDERLCASLDLASADKTLVAVCYIDLDGFKAVNDQLGHAAGDAVLVETAKRIVACVRSHDTVTRLGGDEFAVVISRINDRRQVETILERLLGAMRRPVDVAEGQANVRASIGVAYAPDHGFDAKVLTESADAALYVAKRAGKDCYRVAETQMKLEAEIATLR